MPVDVNEPQAMASSPGAVAPKLIELVCWV
jgi:hypothetical protein